MDGTTRLSWRLDGMDCAACVAKVTTAVERMPGVSGVSVSLFGKSLAFDLAPGGAEPEAVARQVRALGYGVTTEPAPHGHRHHDDDEEDGAPWWNTAKARLVWMLGALVAAAWIAAHLVPAAAYPLYLGATLAAVFPFGRRALALARAGSPFSIETLMVTAALGATLIGAAEEAAFVVLLFAVGEMLEGVAAGRARRACSLPSPRSRPAPRRLPPPRRRPARGRRAAPARGRRWPGAPPAPPPSCRRRCADARCGAPARPAP